MKRGDPEIRFSAENYRLLIRLEYSKIGQRISVFTLKSPFYYVGFASSDGTRPFWIKLSGNRCFFVYVRMARPRPYKYV